MNPPTKDARRPRRLDIDVIASSITLAVACGAVYVLMTNWLGPALTESTDSHAIGAMWAVISTIFVFRCSLEDRLDDATIRMSSTALSLVICLAYLLIFPVTAIGIGAAVGLSSLLAIALGRPQDAALTAITSTVVLVVAHLGEPTPEWIQPLLRLLDTAIGIAAGLAAGALFTSAFRRDQGRVGHGSATSEQKSEGRGTS
ncbi:FUSC family protein [Williamsia soli]|uniref:FUSC family protein n=1 Tax=Williamsia soli TaxID=364929 RepID=UPI001A9EDB8B|nr:FUSC family protein [Williamsia soli]